MQAVMLFITSDQASITEYLTYGQGHRREVAHTCICPLQQTPRNLKIRWENNLFFGGV